MGYALFICRSQTEAIGMRRNLTRLGVVCEVTRPPRQSTPDSCAYAVRISEAQVNDALWHLRRLGIAPLRVVADGGGGR